MLNHNDSMEIIIIGGSLVGLTLALACATRGMPVRIIERSSGYVSGGDSLSIDLAAVSVATGYDPRVYPALPVVPAYRELTTWPALYAWLRARVSANADIILEEGKTVSSVKNIDDQAVVFLSDGTQRNADVVIGADGYRSIVRQAIIPDEPYAVYAGYLVWRGLVEERLLERPVQWPSNGGLWIEFVDGYRLVAATLPGRDGSVLPGQRQITFAWFDVHQTALLYRTGCLTNDHHIIGTLRHNMIDNNIRENLVAKISELWPETWAEAVTVGVRSIGVLSGAPIAEYKPAKLVQGALAIVGDAAHVVSPMTGRGYLTGVEDASLLAQMLANRSANESVAIVLSKYEKARLPFARALVTHSNKISTDYFHYAMGIR